MKSSNPFHPDQSWPTRSSVPRTEVQEETIDSIQLEVERKTICVSLKKNTQGSFLRITEEAHGRRNSVIIPSTGLQELKELVDAMLRRWEEGPSASAEGNLHPSCAPDPAS